MCWVQWSDMERTVSWFVAWTIRGYHPRVFRVTLLRAVLAFPPHVLPPFPLHLHPFSPRLRMLVMYSFTTSNKLYTYTNGIHIA